MQAVRSSLKLETLAQPVHDEHALLLDALDGHEAPVRPPCGLADGSGVVDRRGAERHPAWLESVLRHHRSAEPSARAGQVDSATVTLLRMEAMGIEGLPGTAKAGRVRARGMEREQERPRPMANLEDPGTVVGDADEFLQRLGLATTGARQARAACIQHNEPPCT
jgi:hypothetical protein